MHHPKFLRSKSAGSAIFPAALLCLMVSGCADQQPTDPMLPRIAESSNVPFNRFFLAWSRTYRSSPIQTQTFALDVRQDRQYAEFYADANTFAFARAHPGQLYIVGDEPDQYCVPPDDYAVYYHNFVQEMRAVDPTARFSPAGFAEPNDRCCPDPVSESCRTSMHSIGYADQFYNGYVRRYGSAPRVNEWRFHDFGLALAVGDMDSWWARVDKAASWSVAHGANMVLGAWGFAGWRHESVPVYQEFIKQGMGRLLNDGRINAAVYWSYEPWIHSPRYLANEDGTLTPEGQTYANPLTDVPAGLVLEASETGQAALRWSNTTSAWATEAEFWVQAPGSGSFAYSRTEVNSGPGASQTPEVAFLSGDIVKARVRYYNVHGQAEWSPFSDAVTIEGGKKRSPLPCFDSKRIQSQPCG